MYVLAVLYDRGYPVNVEPDGWHYADTGEHVTNERACRKCGLMPVDVDPCLGWLPCRQACCGHGVTAMAYVSLLDGQRLAGEAALNWFQSALAK